MAEVDHDQREPPGDEVHMRINEALQGDRERGVARSGTGADPFRHPVLDDRP